MAQQFTDFIEIMSTVDNQYRWIMLSFSFFLAFMLHLLLFSTAPMVTVIMEEMRLTYAQFGFIFSVAMISLVIFRIPWGLLGDRIGYLGSIRIALPLVAIAAVARSLSLEYWAMLLSQFLLGVGLSVVLPCLPLVIKEWVPGSIGLATGIYVSGFAAGNATALVLTPWLLHTLSWQQVLLVYSGFTLLICIAWWILARSSLKVTAEFQVSELIRVLKDRYVWILLLLMAASMGCYDTLATWMPKVLELRMMNRALASLLPLGFFLAGPTMGFIVDRVTNRRAIIASLGVVATASIIGINYAELPLLAVCIFGAGFSTIGVLTISLAAPAQHHRLTGSVATVVGLTSSLGNVGPLAVPVTFGLLIDVTTGYQWSIIMVAMVALVAFIIGARVSE